MTQSQLQEQLRSLRLGHFAQALLQQQSQATTYDEMSFEERLGLLAQHEIHCRQDSKVKRLLRQATSLNSMVLRGLRPLAKRHYC